MADVQDAPSASPDQPEPDFAAFEAATLASLGTNFQPTKADPAPAKPVEQAASTDALPTPASEPGKKHKGAKARSAELDQENAELQEKLRIRAVLREELAKGAKDATPDPSPAPVKTAAQESARYKAMPGYPQVAEFEDYGDYTAAVSDFVSSKRLEEYSHKAKQEYDAGQFRELHQRFDARGTEAFPDFRDVLMAAGQAGRQWPEHVTRKVLAHEQGPAIARALALAKDDDALYARIADPVEFGEYVGEFLAQYRAPTRKSVPQKTSAPDPPLTLGSHLTDAPDAERAAVAAGDFPTFEAALMSKLRGA